MADVLNTTTGIHYATITLAHAAAGTLAGHVLEIQDSDTYNETPTISKAITLRAAAGQTPTVKGGGSGQDVIHVSVAGATIQGASSASRLTLWNTYAGTVAIQQGSCVRLTANNIGITLRNLTFRGTQWPGVYAGVNWWQYLGAGLNCASGTQETNTITIANCGSYDDNLGYLVLCNDLKTFVGTDLDGSYQDAAFRCLYWGGTLDRAEMVAPAWFRLWLSGNNPLFWNHMTHRLGRAALVSRSRLVAAAARQQEALWLLSSGVDGLRRIDLLNCTLAAGDADARTLKGLYLGAYAVPGGSRFENLVITDFATRVESGHATGITLVESDVFGAAGTDYAGTAAAGAGCIDADPLYTDLSANNVRLLAASPCKWTGMDSGMTPDPDGTVSPQPLGTSMGAFEVADAVPQVSSASHSAAFTIPVVFSEAMNPAAGSIATASAWTVVPGGGLPSATVTAASPVGATCTLTVAGALIPGATYTVTAPADCQDLGGTVIDGAHRTATFVALYYSTSAAGSTSPSSVYVFSVPGGAPLPGVDPWDPLPADPSDPLVTLACLAITSLGTDREAQDSDVLPAGGDPPDRRGWWADRQPTDDGSRIGSRLWLLAGAAVNDDTAARARAYAEESLAWLVTDGLAESVTATAEVTGSGQERRLEGQIVIVRGDGTGVRILWPELWED
ncbi:MAG: phage GP46 family protein [Deltaproteobacteria bacterium]|nr:phage GP46 family protein [Deltaproteobacteria bacterium]